MLLHVLLVVMLGNTITGGARRGDGLLGALVVTLRQLAPERGSGFTLAPGADTELPGAALLRRLPGAATAPSPPPPRGETARTAAPQAPAIAAPEERAPAEGEVREAVPEVSLPTRPPPAETLPRLDRSAPVEVDKAIAPPAVSPPIPERDSAPAAPTPPREVSLPPIAPLERITPPKIERQFAPPIELRPREVPVAPRAPPVEFKPREEPAPAAPAERVAPANVEREATPAAEVRPRDVPMPPIAPIERIAPPAIERQLAPPVLLPAPRPPMETTAPPSQVAPAAERETVPAAQPLPRSAPVEIAPGLQPAAPAVAPGRAPPAQAPARTDAPAGGELPRLRFGAPDVDDEVFRSRRDAVAPSPTPGSGINTESLHKRAREIASEGGGPQGVLNIVPPPPPQERKDTLAEGIAKAAKPDCRTAYAGMGLLAIAPLVASTAGNGGCRW